MAVALHFGLSLSMDIAIHPVPVPISRKFFEEL